MYYKSKKYNIIYLIFILILVAATFLYISYRSYILSPISKKNKQIIFRVERGESRKTVINKMYKNKIIKNKFFANLYAKNKKIGKDLKQGVYILNTSMSPSQILDKVLNGKTDKDPGIVYVTIPEGFTVKEIAERLNKEGLINDIDSFINECQNGAFNYEFLKSIPKDRNSRLEGYLFPDTYEFEKGLSNHDIIDKMLLRFNDIYESVVVPQMKGQNYSVDDIIIMASIVEEEAKIDSERPMISKVFYNRIKKNMKLQSCATVQYALGTHKTTLYYKDLKIESPYNTYKYLGLPKGPICNPGKKSIEAALNPADVDYIYFVSKGDGSHYFTNDYNEFLKYKKMLKKTKN
ncbi:MAG: endolytic transglycosylase MltG [Caloramator sp.]|nr:endolytic transglycosylase MltG [Caloramator sp.]